MLEPKRIACLGALVPDKTRGNTRNDRDEPAILDVAVKRASSQTFPDRKDRGVGFIGIKVVVRVDD